MSWQKEKYYENIIQESHARIRHHERKIHELNQTIMYYHKKLDEVRKKGVKDDPRCKNL